MNISIPTLLIVLALAKTVWNLNHKFDRDFSEEPEGYLNEVHLNVTNELKKVYFLSSNVSNTSKSSRCLCKLGLGGPPLPIPFPIPVPNNNVNNNVAAFQQLPDGRTALYNNMGQIIGYLPAGTTAQNNG